VHEEWRWLWFGFSGLKHEDPGHKVGFRVYEPGRVLNALGLDLFPGQIAGRVTGMGFLTHG
jgi:hypothetical protein